MRFYYDFLERMSGKKNLERAAFKVSILVCPLLGLSHTVSQHCLHVARQDVAIHSRPVRATVSASLTAWDDS